MNYEFHFIFGLSKNFNDKPFCYFHYLCIKSCYLTQNKPKILIHCVYQPQDNIWWEQAKDFCQIVKYNNLPDLVYKCNNKTVWRIEHQTDILRLLILKEHGGVYADVDNLFYKPFFPTFENKQFVIGMETLYHIFSDSLDINGLCNALIICNKDSEFLNLWLESFSYEFDDYDYNKMAVRVPYQLYLKYPNLVHAEPTRSFHKYNWDFLFYTDEEKYSFYTSQMNDSGIYSKHLAESKVYDYLKKIDQDYFNKNNGLFSKMCKNIEGLL